jgi:microcystin degradation protein MlrC
MPRILIAECKQEVSSFNPVPSHYDGFLVAHGAAILEQHAGSQSEVAGALSVFRCAEGVQLVPTYSARAVTSARWPGRTSTGSPPNSWTRYARRGR